MPTSINLKKTNNSIHKRLMHDQTVESLILFSLSKAVPGTHQTEALRKVMNRGLGSLYVLCTDLVPPVIFTGIKKFHSAVVHLAPWCQHCLQL